MLIYRVQRSFVTGFWSVWGFDDATDEVLIWPDGAYKTYREAKRALNQLTKEVVKC